ncbi:MAG: 4-(cytidine 5'-diphospho)-2-C-methyl-D-erythritol kinase [Gammaproteobacteria bacterium]|nr:4-(cytidine 5'-diphospho)-2-C-methyl-D-erythritol kinase [Gammaproteobacteria bacterium]MDE2345286.1 4-(cytidine 5'-diphospho)-2-C-methyl-D-erythritol kinase [Gammaproteobacteria bacterium]
MIDSCSRGWPAPAKLNLFLHVTGRRADGYHLVQTLYQLLDYGDVLDFELRSDARILRTGGLQHIPEEHDLVVRAARLLQSRSAGRRGIAIHLRKQLPEAGGLGGGSSDAATTLVALNHLWQTGLSQQELMRLGQELGADVPLFVLGQTAWAEGIGELLQPVELPETWFLVVQPPCKVSTREMFQAHDLTRNSPPITISSFYAGATRNDFEPLVRLRHPAVAEALDWLGQRVPARLTGSGACVFGAYARESTARTAMQELPGKWRGFVARGRNRSPLLDRLVVEDNR